MSVRMKTLRISEHPCIDVRITTPKGQEFSYSIPASEGKHLTAFLKKHGQACGLPKSSKTPVLWEKLAHDRLEKYKQAGIVLRGARYRENLSQVELAKRSGVHQNEISKIENGKRGVGEKVAKRLALALHLDYRLLLEN